MHVRDTRPRNPDKPVGWDQEEDNRHMESINRWQTLGEPG